MQANRKCLVTIRNSDLDDLDDEAVLGWFGGEVMADNVNYTNIGMENTIGIEEESEV